MIPFVLELSPDSDSEASSLLDRGYLSFLLFTLVLNLISSAGDITSLSGFYSYRKFLQNAPTCCNRGDSFSGYIFGSEILLYISAFFFLLKFRKFFKKKEDIEISPKIQSLLQSLMILEKLWCVAKAAASLLTAQILNDIGHDEETLLLLIIGAVLTLISTLIEFIKILRMPSSSSSLGSYLSCFLFLQFVTELTLLNFQIQILKSDESVSYCTNESLDYEWTKKSVSKCLTSVCYLNEEQSKRTNNPYGLILEYCASNSTTWSALDCCLWRTTDD
jgi:hypothetical protein